MDEKTRERNETRKEKPGEEDKQLPEELWEMVRAELQQAARVLRTLTDPLFADEPSTTAQPTSTAKTEGWFARLVEQGRQMTHPQG